MYTPSYNNYLAWEMVRVVGIIFLAKKDNFFEPPERHLTERTGDYGRETSFASLVLNMAAWSPSRRLRQGNYSK